MNAAGRAVAAWYVDSTSDSYEVAAARFSPTSGWEVDQTAGFLYSPNIAPTTQKVAIDGSGNSIVTFYEYTYESQFAYLCYLEVISDDGWQRHVIDSYGYSVNVAMSENDTAFISWVRLGQIYVNRYEPIYGWGIPTPFRLLMGSVGETNLAVNNLGNAVLIYERKDGENTELRYSRFE